MREQDFYSAEEVAELLDLHVRTVRRFVREGKLRAARVGRQYRIAARDLDAFLGTPEPRGAARVSRQRNVIVSATVDVAAIGPEEAQRVATFLTAAFSGAEHGGGKHVECIYYEEQGQLRIVVSGDLGFTSAVLGFLSGLPGAGEHDRSGTDQPSRA